jgi:hypothetical protein
MMSIGLLVAMFLLVPTAAFGAEEAPCAYLTTDQTIIALGPGLEKEVAVTVLDD